VGEKYANQKTSRIRHGKSGYLGIKSIKNPAKLGQG
jgi:hypothetical protein